MTDIAHLGIQVDSDTVSVASQRLREMSSEGGKAQSVTGFLKEGFGKLGTGIIAANQGLQLAITAFSTLKGAVDNLTRAWYEQEMALSTMNAVLKSTHGAAGLTMADLTGMADAMQKSTVYSDDLINSAQAVLLTFKEIKGDTFERALKSIEDISTVMGGDLVGAAVQVGKALQDPEMGLTALRRVGVSFSDAQTKVIEQLSKTGQTAKAQDLILQELETEFGGAATAAGQTAAGGVKILDHAFGELSETIGKMIAESLDPANRRLADVVNQANEALIKLNEVKKLVAQSGGVVTGWEAQGLVDQSKQRTEENDRYNNLYEQYLALEKQLGRVGAWGRVNDPNADFMAGDYESLQQYVFELQKLVDLQSKQAAWQKEVNDAYAKTPYGKYAALLEQISNFESKRAETDNTSQTNAKIDAILKGLYANKYDFLAENYAPKNNPLEVDRATNASGIEAIVTGQENVADSADQATEAEQKLADAVKNVWSDLEQSGINLYIDAMSELGKAIAESTDNSNAFSDALGNIGKTIMQELPQLMLQAGLQLLGTSAWPIGLALIVASGIATGVESFVSNKSADGNVFGPSGVMAFAGGGIVDRPTLFRFAGGVGLMGEAGPEAIMPLSRGADGKLGVRGGGGTAVTINNYSGAPVQTREKQGPNGPELEVMIGAMIDRHIASGKADTAMGAAYGLSRKGVRS